MKLNAIRAAVMDVQGNVAEAREKMRKAWEYRECSKAYADWQKDMAIGHLAYNTSGAKLAGEIISQARTDQVGNERAQGTLDVYEEWLRRTTADAAEVKAMADSYK